MRALDPVSGDVIASIPLGTAPSAVSVGEGGVWVLDADDRTVSEIDPETRAVVRTFSTSSTPTDIAAGAGGVWIGSTTSAGGVVPSSVSRVDPESGLLVETVELPPARIGGAGKRVPGEQPTAHRRRAGCRLGDQPRSHRLAHRPAIEPDRRPGREGPGREHRNGRRRRLDHRGQHRHRDRQRHERGRSTADARRRVPRRPRDRRRRGVGDRSRGWQGLARRHRPATRGASRPARDVGRRSRLRRRSGVGDERDHRRDPSHRPADERDRAHRHRRVAPRRRRGRGRGLGDGGVAAVAGSGSPALGLPGRPIGRCREPGPPARVEPPAPGREPRSCAVHGRWHPSRPRAARVRGRRVLGRLPGVRLLDGAGRRGGLLPLRHEREGVLAQRARRRRHRLVPVVLLVPADPDHEPGPGRTAGDDQPIEHGGPADRRRRSLPVRDAELLPSRCAQSSPGPCSGGAREGAGPRPALRARLG